MRILMIVALSEPDLLSIDQVIVPYYVFRDGGAEVVIASVDGSSPIARPGKLDSSTVLLRYRDDPHARAALSDMLSLQQVYPEDFEAICCIGADFAALDTVAHPVRTLIRRSLEEGRPVALVSQSAGAGVSISARSPRLVAHALLGAFAGLRRDGDVQSGKNRA